MGCGEALRIKDSGYGGRMKETGEGGMSGMKRVKKGVKSEWERHLWGWKRSKEA